VTTSLDMTRPAAASEAARIDWAAWMAQVLPQVDVFAPSLDEIRMMLEPASSGPPTARELRSLGDRLIAWGARIVALKLGEHGLYLRTTRDLHALAGLGRAAPADPGAWCGRELAVPCFRADVVGTTGAGDSTTAGLLTGIALGHSPEAVITGAAGVGACSVEAADANSAVPPWHVVQARILAGWPHLAPSVAGFEWNTSRTLGIGSADLVHGDRTE
jgi:sugar/nucleoside kinase (ribokinase family)